MDKLTPEERRKNMQAVKSKGSKIEKLFGRALWSKGYRYRKNDKSVYGKPDFTFKKYKIAIFCDSEFWHGKNWSLTKEEHKSNIDFWYRKIERNIARDIEVNEKLSHDGWTILRFWGKDIEKNLLLCIDEFEKVFNAKKQDKSR